MRRPISIEKEFKQTIVRDILPLISKAYCLLAEKMIDAGAGYLRKEDGCSEAETIAKRKKTINRIIERQSKYLSDVLTQYISYEEHAAIRALIKYMRPQETTSTKCTEDKETQQDRGNENETP